MITNEQIIKFLNEDIALEYSAAIQYVQHANTITWAEYQSIQKELVIHVTEEINHANLLSEQVAYLWWVPTMEVWKRTTDIDSKKMLEQDLDWEKFAIKRYKERIKQAQELELYWLERVLKLILSEEEEHERDISQALWL